MSVGELSVGEMSIGEMSVGEMSVGEMSWIRQARPLWGALVARKVCECSVPEAHLRWSNIHVALSY